MEFSLREWLIVVGIIVIVGVLLDGYRRVRSGSRDRLKMSIDKSQKISEKDKMDYFNGELPNGGARAVNRTDDEVNDQLIDKEKPIPAFDVAHELRPDPLFADEAESQNPELGGEVGNGLQNEFEPALERNSRAEFQNASEQLSPAQAASAQETQTQKSAAPQPLATDNNEISAEPEVVVSYQDVEEVIVMNVFAKDEKGFNGDELMRVILACGMRYGDMDIFHRSEEGANGTVQFSMANIVKPGTFDLDAMNNFYTPGVSFFLSLPGPKNSIKALDYMQETAQCVVKNLDGDLKDEMHSAMTGQTIEHLRQKVRDFERRQLSLLR